MRPERLQAWRQPLTFVAAALALLLGLWLALATARELRDYHAVLAQHGGAVVDLGQAMEPVDGLQGQMVRITGTPRVVVSPYDADFNQKAAVVVLTRQVAMFQWRELRLGNQVTYEQDWVDHPVDSSRFADPRGHANPGAFPIKSARFVSDSVQLGGYTLGDALLHALPGSEPVPLDAHAVPANFAATFTAYDNALVTSDVPTQPQVGDLRLRWSGVPAQEITVIARVDGDHLVAVPNAADGQGYEVNVGDSSLLDMRPDMAAQPAGIWLRRLLALLLASGGTALLWLGLRQRVDAPAALGGGLLLAGLGSLLGGWGGGWPGTTGALAALLIGGGLLAWRWRRADVQRGNS